MTIEEFVRISGRGINVEYYSHSRDGSVMVRVSNYHIETDGWEEVLPGWRDDDACYVVAASLQEAWREFCTQWLWEEST